MRTECTMTPEKVLCFISVKPRWRIGKGLA